MSAAFDRDVALAMSNVWDVLVRTGELALKSGLTTWGASSEPCEPAMGDAVVTELRCAMAGGLGPVARRVGKPKHDPIPGTWRVGIVPTGDGRVQVLVQISLPEGAV